MHAYRTHNCGALRASDAGQDVRLSGWIHRKRDHGGLMFIDLRDHHGLTQLVLSPESAGFAVVDHLRAESVIQIDGQVVARSAETVNPALPTGEIEVRVRSAAVLSEAQELPVPVFGEPDYPEDLRLKHRYLDLRRETLHRNIVLRSQVIASIRRRMIESGFTEFQTPILTASSPEGARDFLVPSRMHPGEFYALPQAPQQFKQLLMVAASTATSRSRLLPRRDARADRSRRVLPARSGDELRHPGRRLRALEAGAARVFEEFAEGKAVTPTRSPHPYPREHLQVRHRQARPAQTRW
jgi:aspartyl-tRNA synthetase